MLMYCTLLCYNFIAIDYWCNFISGNYHFVLCLCKVIQLFAVKRSCFLVCVMMQYVVLYSCTPLHCTQVSLIWRPTLTKVTRLTAVSSGLVAGLQTTSALWLSQETRRWVGIWVDTCCIITWIKYVESKWNHSRGSPMAGTLRTISPGHQTPFAVI